MGLWVCMDTSTSHWTQPSRQPLLSHTRAMGTPNQWGPQGFGQELAMPMVAMTTLEAMLTPEGLNLLSSLVVLGNISNGCLLL